MSGDKSQIAFQINSSSTVSQRTIFLQLIRKVLLTFCFPISFRFVRGQGGSVKLCGNHSGPSQTNALERIGRDSWFWRPYSGRIFGIRGNHAFVSMIKQAGFSNELLPVCQNTEPEPRVLDSFPWMPIAAVLGHSTGWCRLMLDIRSSVSDSALDGVRTGNVSAIVSRRLIGSTLLGRDESYRWTNIAHSSCVVLSLRFQINIKSILKHNCPNHPSIFLVWALTGPSFNVW
jgi:hypothetical protein